ncbi:hypothetical protein Bbelb_361950 [Branchiostoma belcheri]|nr:hypothetical protein Bbelb_361950 [Branchiostoma belcheri]
MPEKTRTTRESTRREAEVTGVVQKGGDSAAIMNELKSLSQKIDGMQSSLEKQLNKKKMVTETKDELKAELERKTEEIGVNIDLEMGHVMARIEAIEKKMSGTNKADRPGEFDPDESVIVSGLPFEEGEDIQAKIEGLLRTGIHSDVPVVAAERMKPRGRGPGVVKVKLRGNRSNKRKPLYEKVFLRSAKSHTDRLIELNFRTLLWEIPGGKDYFITGSERVKKRGARDLPADNNVSPQP